MLNLLKHGNQQPSSVIDLQSDGHDGSGSTQRAVPSQLSLISLLQTISSIPNLKHTTHVTQLGLLEPSSTRN